MCLISLGSQPFDVGRETVREDQVKGTDLSQRLNVHQYLEAAAKFVNSYAVTRRYDIQPKSESIYSSKACTVDPPGTDTSLMRTPLYYGQFPMSRENSHIFSF